MKEAYEYLGHSIELTLTINREHLGYTYFIDTKYCFQGSTNSLDVAVARANALRSAHRSIAALNAMAAMKLSHYTTSSTISMAKGGTQAAPWHESMSSRELIHGMR